MRTLELTSIALELCYRPPITFKLVPRSAAEEVQASDSDSEYLVEDSATDPIKNYLSSMDVRAYAESLLSKIPTLEHIHVVHGSGCGHSFPHDPAWYFQILRAGDGAASLVNLDPMEGEELFERLAG